MARPPAWNREVVLRTQTEKRFRSQRAVLCMSKTGLGRRVFTCLGQQGAEPGAQEGPGECDGPRDSGPV